MELLWLMLFYLYSCGGYFYFSHHPTNFHLMTPWEKYVPTLPVFILPYALATLSFLVLPIYFYLKLGWTKTKKYLVAQTIANSMAYLVYFFYPTSVIRGPLNGQGFFWDLLRILHANDRPSAAFPSGHVYQTTIIAYFLWLWYPKSRPFVAVILPLVIASTVLLKQHFLLDIPGGLLVALIALFATNFLDKKAKVL